MLRSFLPRLLSSLAALPVVLVACSSSSEDAASCKADVSQANAILDAAGVGSGCTVDSDCSVLYQAPTCAEGCGGYFVSKQSTSAFTSAVAKANSGPCADFSASSCTSPEYDCPYEQGSAAPQCIAGSCTTGYEADWTSVAVQVQPVGGDIPLVGRCEAGCTEWSLTPDHLIAVTHGTGSPSSVTMSDDDFSIVDGTLRDPSFRQALLASVGDATSPIVACPADDTADAGASPGGLTTLMGIVRSVSYEAEGTVPACTPNGAATIAAILQTYGT